MTRQQPASTPALDLEVPIRKLGLSGCTQGSRRPARVQVLLSLVCLGVAALLSRTWSDSDYFAEARRDLDLFQVRGAGEAANAL
jgi:hypothetical protein